MFSAQDLPGVLSGCGALLTPCLEQKRRTHSLT